MKKIHTILAIALLLVSSAVMAQQESAYAFYRQHMNLVNPASVGQVLPMHQRRKRFLLELL
jgi:hypothetical protein